MKKIVKNFNNLIEKTIFNVQNKTNNNYKISNFNKYLISFIGLLFFWLFYLLIPLLYEKNWVQTNIERKLLNEFKVNLSASADISYRILPGPHFLIKDSKILTNDDQNPKPIAEIKNLKVFLNHGNFFNKEMISLKKIVISEANFLLSRSDFNLLDNIRNIKFSGKKIKVNDSNIFFKDSLDEIITIVKIDKAIVFFDNKKLLNLLNLTGELFNIPFTFDFNNHNDPIKNQKTNFNAKYLKLNITNESIKENNSINGKNYISFLNKTINTKYNIKNKLITFESDDYKIENHKPTYSGELSINPFDLNLNINLDNHKISKLFNINPFLIELFKSDLLFNENISVDTSVVFKSSTKHEIFQNAKINFHIINGKINFDNTKFINDKIGYLELNNSNFFFEDNKLLLNTNILIVINDSDRLFSKLNTNKSFRKDIKKILINLNYDFLSNQFNFNNIRVEDQQLNDQLLPILESFKDNNLNNLIKSRRLINELLGVYAG